MNLENKEPYANAYCSALFNDGATRKQIGKYLKTCHTKFDMSYEFIDKILNNEVGYFFHFSNNFISPIESEYDYININEDGSIYIWCEVDGFVAYLHNYKQTWFTDKEFKLLKPFLRECSRKKHE